MELTYGVFTCKAVTCKTRATKAARPAKSFMTRGVYRILSLNIERKRE